jgi:hypothetical protein
MVTVKSSPDLLEVAERSRQAFRERDQEWFADSLAHGEVANYGTAPGEEWHGREQILALTLAELRRMSEEVGIDVDYEDPDRRVEAFEAGDAGWVVVHSVFRFADGSTVSIRSIILLSRDDDGAWKTVLSSVHTLVPNEVLEPGAPGFAELATTAARGPQESG